MRTVDAVNTYKGTDNSYPRESQSLVMPMPKRLADIRDNASKISSVQLKDTNNVVNSNERQFFVKMYPESSAQIQKHVLFNRNGRLQEQNISKGMLIDGRV